MRERRYAPLNALKRIEVLELGGGSGAAWGGITGTLSNQTDLQSALNAKLSVVTAADIDAGASTDGQVLTSDGLGGVAWETPVAGVTTFEGRSGAVLADRTDYDSFYVQKDLFGGTQTIQNSLTMEGTLIQVDTSNDLRLINNTGLRLTDTSSSDRVRLSMSGTSNIVQLTPFPNATLTFEVGGGFAVMEVDCKLVANQASDSTESGFKIVPGTAPTTPENGDIWVTTTAMFVHINGTTVQLAAV